MELYPIQMQAATKLAGALRELGAALNASQTGTGKTLVGLEVARQLALQPLVVAPLAAHGTWRYWAQEQKTPFVGLANVERLRTGKTPWVSAFGKGKNAVYQWNLKGGPNGHIVLFDEIHRGLSGTRTQAGAMAAMLRPQGIKVLLMSATPFSSPLNMRSSGYILRLHDYSTNSFFNFCRRHGCVNSHWHRGLEFDPESRGAKLHLARVNELLQDRMVHLTVEDMAEFFGENIVEPTPINLSDRDTDEANRIYAEMDVELKKKNQANPLVEMTRARQRVELLAVPAIAEMVQDSLEEGNSVFVAQSFKQSVHNLHNALLELGVADIGLITGDSPPKDRDAFVEDFQRGTNRVLLATSEAGGMSISLHRTREDQRPRTSIIRPNYKADVLIQCLGRIYRAGMTKHPVVQRIVLCAGTIEERVYRRLLAKMRNINSLVDGDLI